jgi:hypothetical protein
VKRPDTVARVRPCYAGVWSYVFRGNSRQIYRGLIEAKYLHVGDCDPTPHSGVGFGHGTQT